MKIVNFLFYFSVGYVDSNNVEVDNTVIRNVSFGFGFFNIY